MPLRAIAIAYVINVVFWTWSASATPTSFLGRLGSSERTAWIAAKIAREYGIKVVIAILLTPLIYALHGLLVRSLGLEPAPAEKKSSL